jgi:hypothetical protein
LPDGVPPEELDPIARRLDELARTHARALQAFTERLPAQVRTVSVWLRGNSATAQVPSHMLQAHDEVRFLLYRLDFNEFNARMRVVAEEDD